MLKLDGGFVPAISEKPSGKESLVEQWILQKLDNAAADVHKSLTDRNFMNATAEAYNFWLYEICDVYIVRLSQPHSSVTSLIHVQRFTGSYQAHDGPFRSCRGKTFGAEHALHCSRQRFAIAASLYALCDRRVVAAIAQTAHGSHEDHHAGQIPRVCELINCAHLGPS